MAAVAGDFTPLLEDHEGLVSGAQEKTAMTTKAADVVAPPSLPPTARQNRTSVSALMNGPHDRNHRRRTFPQAIAHRGFKAAAPENTMLAFRSAVEDARAHAIETDLHLSRDGVVVLSHDETLKRCFGEDARVRDRDWSYLSRLRTLRMPEAGQTMPSLAQLLEYLAQPGREEVWLLLDVKTHDDAEEIMRRTAETLASVPGPRSWSERVTPCCWNAKYVKLAMKYLPGYHITHVGFSVSYARCLLAHVPDLSFSIIHWSLAMPSGKRFLRDMKRLGVRVHAWTINKEDSMEWSIRKELDGVITDEPKLFLEVCGRMGADEKEGGELHGMGRLATVSRRKTITDSLGRRMKFLFGMLFSHILLTVISTVAWLKNGSQRRSIRKTLESP